MYTLAGNILEKLSHQPFEGLVNEKLLQPLGMNSSNFRHEGNLNGILRASQYGYIYSGSPPVKITPDKYRYQISLPFFKQKPL